MKTQLIKMILTTTMVIIAISFCPAPQGDLTFDPIGKRIFIPIKLPPILWESNKM